MTCNAIGARLFLCALTTLPGCADRDGAPPLLWAGRSGIASPAFSLEDVLITDVLVDGRSRAKALIDTGAPISLLTTEAFGNDVSRGASAVSTLTVAGITLVRPQVVGESGTVQTVGGLPFRGILGFSAFVQCS